MEGIGVIIVVVVVIYLYNLSLQGMAKASGKNFKFRGVSRTIVKPTDFDESIATLKRTKQNINFFINKFSLSANEQIIYKFEKLLRKDYSNLVYKYSNFEEVNRKYHNLEKKIRDLEEREKNDLLIGKFRIYRREEDTNYLGSYLSILRQELYDYSNRFKVEDSNKIIEFVRVPLNDQKTKIVEFLDKLGLENFSNFCLIIDELTEMYIRNKVTKNEIENIKMVILYYKGIISITI